MIELLAPASDLEKLKIALLYGADAVYIGGVNFSLRANAKNFSNDEIKEAVLYAHNLNKKVYVTVNILFHNEDLNGLKEYLIFLNSINVDGIIASDIVVIKMINELNLNIKIILSTQASIKNVEAAKFYENMGVKQVVMAREASKEDIMEIKKQTNLEIECFIHGAMCTSVSGKCNLSNFVTLRDANRGGCAQICRWTFNENDKYPFTMTSKDLNLIEYIKDMIDIGVNTFKVEGRMRGVYYIATIILCYRRIIDKILNNTFTIDDKNYYLNVLNRCANRESSPQFFANKPNENDQYYNNREEESNQDFLGIVLDFDKEKGIATIEERNFFKTGDIVEFIGPNIETFEQKINIIYDEDNNMIDKANIPRMIIKIKVKNIVNINDIMRIKINIDKDI